MAEYPPSLEVKFRHHIALLSEELGPDECWPWNAAAVRNDTYGQLGTAVEGRRIKLYVHRMSQDLLNGALEPGDEVLHSCDYKPCCNPRHLRNATHRDNLNEAFERSRYARGERQGHARLTEQAVREIRVRRARGELLKVLAGEFGVGIPTVREAAERITWRHVR